VLGLIFATADDLVNSSSSRRRVLFALGAMGPYQARRGIIQRKSRPTVWNVVGAERTSIHHITEFFVAVGLLLLEDSN
jgi:hypothetical protein